MSVKCICKSILYEIPSYDMSITKKKALTKLCEKQIPKQIKFDENDLNVCPACKQHVLSEDKYCSNCGQRIVL